MLFIFLTSIALADLAPPPGPLSTTCDATRCPTGTTQTRWCDSSLGKLAECSETMGWREACRKKAGLKARHMMCKPLANQPARRKTTGRTEPTLVEPRQSQPSASTAAKSTAPADTRPTTEPTARCQTAPAGHLGPLFGLLLPLILIRRRPSSVLTRSS